MWLLLRLQAILASIRYAMKEFCKLKHEAIEVRSISRFGIAIFSLANENSYTSTNMTHSDLKAAIRCFQIFTQLEIALS